MNSPQPRFREDDATCCSVGLALAGSVSHAEPNVNPVSAILVQRFYASEIFNVVSYNREHRRTEDFSTIHATLTKR